MLTVLVVGHSGTARSAATVGLLRAALASDDRRLAIGLACTAPTGGGMAPDLAAALARLGVGRSLLPTVPDRPLRGTDVRFADLVLAVDRRERGRATELAPGALRRVFCLREFADLAREPRTAAHPAGSLSPGGRFAVLVDEAADERGLQHPPRSPEDDAIPLTGAAPSLDVLGAAVSRIAALLTSALTWDHHGVAAGR